MAITMKDVAQRAGVDVSTVSLALNNDPRIRTETRERILAIAHELGYQKNYLARSLRSGRSYTLGVAVRDGLPAWSAVLVGIHRQLITQDYHLLLDVCFDQQRTEMEQVESLRTKRVDGLCIIALNRALEVHGSLQPFYKVLQGQNFPLLFLGEGIPDLETDTIVFTSPMTEIEVPLFEQAGQWAAERFLHRLSNNFLSVEMLQLPHKLGY